MKILVLTSVYKDVSLKDKDLSTNVVNSFVKEWVKLGHEVIVIHNSHCYPSIIHSFPTIIKSKLASKIGFYIADYEAVKKKEYIDNNAKIFRLPIKKYIPHGAPSKRIIDAQITNIIAILKNENFIPDVITGHWASPQLEIISKLKEYFHCKTACVLHGIGYVSNSKYNVYKYLKGIDYLGTRSLTQSKQIKELLELSELPFVCYSGVPNEYLITYELNVQKFNNIQKWKFAYVGRLVSYKNIDAIIKALAKLKDVDWEFDIVGEGAAREELEILSKELNCSDRIRFRGKVSRNQVMQILKDTNVFVMISTNEVFGLVYLEAMAASCITIASKSGGVDGIILDGYNGFLCSEGDSMNLYNILKHIVSSDYSEIETIVKNGYNTSATYSDSATAAKYLETITK